MTIAMHIHDDGKTLISTMQGEITTNDLFKAMQYASETRMRNGVSLQLTDVRGADLEHINILQVEQLAEMAREFYANDGHHTAILVDSQYNAFLAALFKTIVGELENIKIFDDVNIAKKWLASRPTPLLH